MSPKVALILWKRRHEEWTVMKKASWVVLKLPRRLFAPNGNPTPHLFSHYIFSPISSCRQGLLVFFCKDIFFIGKDAMTFMRWLESGTSRPMARRGLKYGSDIAFASLSSASQSFCLSMVL